LPEVARKKAENSSLPVYRKDLRKVFLEHLQWMHAMKKRYDVPYSVANPPRSQRHRRI